MTEKIRNRAGNTIARACSGGEAASLRLRTAAAGPDCRSRKQRKALFYTRPGRRPVRGWDCRSSARRARPPEPEAMESSLPRKAGAAAPCRAGTVAPPPAGSGRRSRKRREAFPARGRGHRLCRVGASPAARRGRCPRGWDCRPSPAGPPPTGLGLPPFVNRGRLPESEAAGSLTRRPPGSLPTGLGLPPVARRARLPEAEAAGSPSHARPGRRPCRVSASPVAPRDAPDDGQYAKPGERCHILSCRYVIYANFMQHGR